MITTPDILEILQMVSERSPQWMRQALCADADPDLFHSDPEDPDRVAKMDAARRVCAHCPVRAQCLSWAYQTDDRFAVLGGLSPNQRKRVRDRVRRKEACA